MHDREASNRKRRLLIIKQSRRHSADGSLVGAQNVCDVLSVNDQCFCTACGFADSIEVAVSKHKGKNSDSEMVTIDRPSILIGRGASCDICLPDPDVSFRHAYLQLIDGQIFCFDLASRAGTFCRSDGRRSGPLRLGEDIFVGPYTLQFSSEERAEAAGADLRTSPAAEAVDGAADEPAAIPETVLKFLNSLPRPEPLALNRAVTLIGKSKRCRVHLLHESVSRVHCSVIRTKTGVWVVDLLGREGTLVNGQAVDVAPLNNGDELTVGRFRMQILSSSSCRSLTRSKAGLARRSRKSPQILSRAVARRRKSTGFEEDAGSTSSSTLIPRPSAQFPQGASTQFGDDLTGHSSEIDAAQPGQPANTFSEKFVMSLVDQFSMMQQQMFQQSQQAMTALAEILKTRHESETELVWKELAHIRELSQELRDLGQELAASKTDPVRRLANAPTQTIETPQPTEVEHVAAAESGNESESVPPKNVDDEAVEELAAQTSDSEADANQRETEIHAHSTDATEPSELADDAPPRGVQFAADDEDSDEDPHLWLAQRMAAIDKERNGRWQKITRLLTGASSDDYHA